MKANKYISIWEETLPEILVAIENGKQNFSIDMIEDDFKAVGNRKSYRFRLQTENGVVTNNIDGTAVARDLYDVLYASSSFMKLAKGKRIVLKMGVEYKLIVEIQAL